MISVYDRLETNFNHNGIVLTDSISCVVEEELNSKYILELTHPIDTGGKWENLVEENVIKAGGQLFRIHATETNLDNIYVNARHIFYDLLHNFLEDVRPTNLDGSAALNWILNNTQYPHNFSGFSDISNINTQYYIRKNPVEALLGADSFITRWGGEIERDNFTIKLLKNRGHNKGTKIAYGKNMLGLEVKKDLDSVVTRIMPIGNDGLMLDEKYVDSPLINNYAFPRIRQIEFDIGIDEETTEQEAKDKLRQAAIDLYEKNKIDVPYVNINTNLLLLENTEEYKHIKGLVDVKLGDVVSCTDNPLNITFEAKVIRVRKDILENRNVEVELGQFKKGISNTIQTAINEVSEEIKHTSTALEKAIEDATEQLRSALGGYVVKRPGELLIMDTEDIATATKVWRYNLNGLGYSENGAEGPYRVAITMDGSIVADFITTGVLDAAIIKTGILNADLIKAGTINADLIKAGILKSADNSSYINMLNGTFNFKNALKWENDELLITSPSIPNTDEMVKQNTNYNGVKVSAERGLVATHGDGSETIVDGVGFKRRITSNGNVYEYLSINYSGKGEFTGKRTWYYSQEDPNPPSAETVDGWVGSGWITIPNPDFIGKKFTVIPSYAGTQRLNFGGVNFSLTIDVEVTEYDYTNGRFKLRARSTVYWPPLEFGDVPTYVYYGARYSYQAFVTGTII